MNPRRGRADWRRCRGTEPPVGDKQISLVERAPEALEKLTFVRVPVAVSRFDECPGEQAENAGQGHGRKTTARLLALALRPLGLVGRSVRHGEACAVDEFDVTPVPELVVGDMTLDAINQMSIDLIHHIEGNFRTGLAVSSSLWTHGGLLLAWESSARESHDLANRFAASPVWRLNLVEKAPENDIERKDAATAVLARAGAREQCQGDVGAKSFAELGKRAQFGKLGESLREARDRRLAKKQGAEGLKERSGVAHNLCVSLRIIDSKHKMRESREKNTTDSP